MKRSALLVAVVVGLVSVFSFAGSGFAAGRDQGVKAPAGKKPRRGARGPAGPAGPVGPAGPTGKNGARGPEGAAGKEGREGRQGPSGIVSISNLSLNSTLFNSGLAFVGQTETVPFDAKTAAHVTASLGFGSSDGKSIRSHFGVCYQPVGGQSEIVDLIQPEFVIEKGESVVQTVSGAISGLTPGEYVIGACSFGETSNTVHGIGYATVIVAEVR
ncbi:MAG: collagen-like protein [Actinobacteria bacterium]|nr:collagen-like protein [Actinomycetota bacterium]